MSQNTDSAESTAEGKQSEQRTCDYGNCDDPVTVRSRTGRYCASDHSIAASNDWDPDELNEYEVEYNGIEGTYRAPSQEQADDQWRSLVIARGDSR